MRLFIAVEFSEKNREALYDMAQKLRARAIQGNTTKRENLHLTLAFIGEVPVSVYKKICAVMDVMSSEGFEIIFDRFGKFVQLDGALYWVGARNNPALLSLQKQLTAALKKNQIPVDEKAFKPHVTLGRRMRMEEGFLEEAFEKDIRPVTQRVNSISLMKSERINGKLVYTEVYRKKL